MLLCAQSSRGPTADGGISYLIYIHDSRRLRLLRLRRHGLGTTTTTVVAKPITGDPDRPLGRVSRRRSLPIGYRLV